ncbi:DUF4112 domain-containing protein [Actibacterium lipolyticum]|uniref:DUF4112 domain-containing protein n=1 Tax=Actibacterium lipolyticum TaxID=1524263 RepID=A0A238JVJ3_9RHOB|nr:DUF4112 domain-containing protein [Actibacterium lipolyticum]SMX34523.1 hypothetical protein COL8621_01352 [Actibacterium lipolyticum]
MDHNIEKRLITLEKLAYRMENLVPLPGTGLRLGLDAMLGFVPVVGDSLALIPAAYIIRSAHTMGAPRRMLIRMGLNVGVDLIIGFVPLIGDAFDIAWNANTKNVTLLRGYLETQTAHAEWARAAVTFEAEPA